MIQEMNAILKDGTWELTKLPPAWKTSSIYEMDIQGKRWHPWQSSEEEG